MKRGVYQSSWCVHRVTAYVQCHTFITNLNNTNHAFSALFSKIFVFTYIGTENWSISRDFIFRAPQRGGRGCKDLPLHEFFSYSKQNWSIFKDFFPNFIENIKINFCFWILIKVGKGPGQTTKKNFFYVCLP